MADSLSTLSTESLTAAVTSLLNKPLPDIQTPNGNLSSVPVRHDTHNSILPQHLIQRQPAPVLTAVSSASLQKNVQPMGISYIVNKPVYSSMNCVTNASQLRAEDVTAAKRLKFPGDNLNVTSSHSSGDSIALNNGKNQQTLMDSSNSFSTLQNISALQNILNSYPQVNSANSTSNLLDSVKVAPNSSLSAIQHMASTQSLQHLIHSLFPQTDINIQHSQSNPVNPVVSMHMENSMLMASNTNLDQNFVNSVPNTTHRHLMPERQLSQTIDGSGVSVMPIPTLTTDQGTLQASDDPQNLMKRNTLQQFPFLLQSSTPGGPLQLIPIGPSLELPVIQLLQQQTNKSTSVSEADSNPVSAPVTIQPKPPGINIQSLLSQTNSASSRQLTSSGLDLNLLQTILNSQLGIKVAGDTRTCTSQSSQFPVAEPIHSNPPLQCMKDTVSEAACNIDVSVRQRDTNVSTHTMACAQSHTLAMSAPAHTMDMSASTHTMDMTVTTQMSADSMNMTSGHSYSMTAPEDGMSEGPDVDTGQHEEDETIDQSYHGDTDGMNTETEAQDQSTSTDLQQTSHTHIFCIDCNKLYTDGCKVHSIENEYVQDTPILSRARASLPNCFYLQQTSTSELKDFLGVWCKEYISERTRFGPVVGDRKQIQTCDYKQQTDGFNPYKMKMTDDQCEVLCLSDETVCNWAMFVRRAHSLMEQNCVLYQDEDSFYIITTTEIKEDEEMLMWFSADMCQQLGISQDPENTKLLQCDQCGKYFTSKKLQTSHLKVSHPDRYRLNWACPMCGKKFSSNSKLNNHMMLHMGLKPHSCSFCNKQFSDASNLKTHMLIHTGQKKYKCDTCGKTFRQKAHLEVHYIVHTGTKKYKCTYCDMRFARPADLKTHTYRHTQEMSYTCATCGKIFYKTQNYKKHLKVHTGERNYMCNKCFKGFQTKYHRDRHLKICKEKNGKESSYMSLEEVAELGNTYEIALKNVTIRRDGCSVEQPMAGNEEEQS